LLLSFFHSPYIFYLFHPVHTSFCPFQNTMLYVNKKLLTIHYSPEDGGKIHFPNVGKIAHVYTV
jgi:hypothetical protein